MSGHRVQAIQGSSQAKKAASAVQRQQILLRSRWGAVLIAALLVAVLLGACGQSGATAQSAATHCVSGQANTLRSGMMTWAGLFSTGWMVNQAQQVTITPDQSLSGGMFQVTSEPVSLSLGQQTIDMPPAFSLHVGGTLARAPAYPVTLSLPVAGCWKITAQLDNASSSIFVRAHAPRGASNCPFSVPSPAASPGDEFVYGADPIFWALTPPYTMNTPIYLTLRVTNNYQVASLPLAAVQIANQGQIINFTATPTQISSNESGTFYQTAQPLVLPASGCWLLSAYAGTTNGTVVVQVQ
jgi:hypothetical protein